MDGKDGREWIFRIGGAALIVAAAALYAFSDEPAPAGVSGPPVPATFTYGPPPPFPPPLRFGPPAPPDLRPVPEPVLADLGLTAAQSAPPRRLPCRPQVRP